MKRVQFLTLLMLGAATAVAGESHSPKQREAVSCEPKVKLENIRIAFSSKDSLYFDLSGDYTPLTNTYFKEHPSWEPESERLTPGIQKAFFESIKEKPGEKFLILNPFSLETCRVELSELILRANTGDWTGVQGMVKSTPAVARFKSSFYDPHGEVWKDGLVLPERRAVRLKREVSEHTSSSDVGEMLDLIRKSDELEAPEHVDTRNVFFRFPNVRATLLRVRGKDIYQDEFKTRKVFPEPYEYVYLFAKDGAGWREVPFRDPNGFYSAKKLVEGGEYCGAPYNTRIAILPDLDHDGGEEIFFSTTETELFALRAFDGWYRAELSAGIYFGP